LGGQQAEREQRTGSKRNANLVQWKPLQIHCRFRVMAHFHLQRVCLRV
jgi:hypothetical protein